MLMRVNIRCLSFHNMYLCFINDQITTLRACNKQLSSVILHRCCHLVVCNRSCSVPPTVPVHFYELGGAGTLFANNQRRRNAVPLRPEALEPLGAVPNLFINLLHLPPVLRSTFPCTFLPVPQSLYSAFKAHLCSK